tara:strand:- start:9511 stop:9681 length:171 start_codon:yes stop_codon:yes gene_type:complete
LVEKVWSTTHKNTQKEEIFDTFFYSSKNVQMNKKYVLKKFHKVGKGRKKWWWWWWW